MKTVFKILKISLFLTSLIASIILSGFFAVILAHVKEEKNLKITTITLEKKGTYYPYYSILSIYNDGTVTYSEKIALQADPVKYTGKITTQKFKELVQIIYENNFFDLNKFYDNPEVLDEFYTIVTVKLDEKIYSVKEYAGAGPESLHNIVIKLL
jgi:hypothetical protein